MRPLVLLCFAGYLLLGGVGCEADSKSSQTSLKLTSSGDRFVSMAPLLSELLVFLGASEVVVGVSEHCAALVPELANRPTVGTFLGPDVERIVALQPSQIFGVSSAGQSAVFAGLRQQGFAVWQRPADSLTELKTLLTDLSQHLSSSFPQAPLRAQQFLRELEAKLAPAGRSKTAQRQAPRVVFVIGHSPLYVAGGLSFVDEMIRAAGGVNAFADVEDDWLPVDLERIIASGADLLVDNTLGEEAKPLVDFWQLYAPELPVVKGGRVYAFPPVRAGLGILKWIDQLQELIEKK